VVLKLGILGLGPYVFNVFSWNATSKNVTKKWRFWILKKCKKHRPILELWNPARLAQLLQLSLAFRCNLHFAACNQWRCTVQFHCSSLYVATCFSLCFKFYRSCDRGLTHKKSCGAHVAYVATLTFDLLTPKVVNWSVRGFVYLLHAATNPWTDKQTGLTDGE